MSVQAHRELVPRAPRLHALRGGAVKRVVVIGNGMVSHGLCDMMTGPGSRALQLTVLGEEKYPAYDRIHLSEVDAPERALLSPVDWYRRRGVELRLDAVVTRIDREEKQVVLAGGESLAYDVLVLATGSQPVLPPIAGIDKPGVFGYRTLDDVRRIRAALAGARDAVVVGGGLLGLESARLALDAGCNTTVVETSRMLMPRQLDPESSEALRARVQALGVAVRLAARVLAIETEEGRLALRFEVGDALLADAVIVATGVRPRDELAREAGLAVSARGGVIVDDGMRSSDPAIYAAGDCACHHGRSYGLIAPGLAMAQVVARSIAGERARFAGADPSCELKLMGIPVAAIGNYEDTEHGQLSRTSAVLPEGRRTLLLQSGRLVGAVAVGAWPELPRVRALIARGKSLSRRRLARFAQTGRLFSGDAAGLTSWPATAVLCNCRQVTKGTLEQCIRTCGPDADLLSERTGAGGACGSCKPLLLELVGREHSHLVVPYASTLAKLSWVVAALTLALWILPGLQFAASVQSSWHALDQVRNDPLFRQASGFAVVGAAALSLLLSLRKRTRVLNRISVGAARAFHALLGTAALLALLLHTGARMGTQLNLALTTCFVGGSLIGALSGSAAAAESARDPEWARVARALRGWMVRTHVLWLWPLPILLGLHILAAYYF